LSGCLLNGMMVQSVVRWTCNYEIVRLTPRRGAPV